MITTTDVAIRVWQMLQASDVKTMISGVIGYDRNDYSKEDIVIIPHAMLGEDSLRFGQVNVNIHVPDKATIKQGVYEARRGRLVELRKRVIEILQRHYEIGEGYNWTVGLISEFIPEENQHEHYTSIALEITFRQKTLK